MMSLKKDYTHPPIIEAFSSVNSSYKVFGRIFNERLKKIANAILLEEQQGFRRGRSIIDNIFM